MARPETTPHAPAAAPAETPAGASNASAPALRAVSGPGIAVPASAPGVIIVDLARIADNWRALQRHVGNAVAAAVVKADAYGLGAREVIPALSAAGASVFFVATLEEAVEARALSGEGATVFVLDGLMPGTAGEMLHTGAWPVLSTREEIAEWTELARARAVPLPCALHLDTGLNRLGLSAGEIRTLVSDPGRLAGLDIRLVMSHLACADEPGHPMNARQRAVFDELRALLPPTAASLAASDGLMLGPDYHYAMVRPGYALYGGQAFQGGGTPVEPVVAAYARILQVRAAAPPATVGYSATYEVPELTRLATISAGYADGVRRTASTATGAAQGGLAAIDGVIVPFVGRVSMDLVTLDVGRLRTAPRRGDLVELVGPTLPLEKVGTGAKTIGYEILTSLGRRFHRVYLGRAASPADEG